MVNRVNIKLITNYEDRVIIVTDENRIFYCDMGAIETEKRWYELKGPDLGKRLPSDLNNRTIFGLLNDE